MIHGGPLLSFLFKRLILFTDLMYHDLEPGGISGKKKEQPSL
ncbi:hypothetical protein HMPREF9413_4031 [Paenibacillus sp. HGF7]|nr:hypothetical protein HMPREF9413_4031 [Paenibacillus sp. HGF7]